MLLSCCHVQTSHSFSSCHETTRAGCVKYMMQKPHRACRSIVLTGGSGASMKHSTSWFWSFKGLSAFEAFKRKHLHTKLCAEML